MSLVAWPLAAPLDDYLREVVTTLRQATDQGMRKVHQAPVDAAHDIEECRSILQVIMTGNVADWVGSTEENSHR
jgi:hypothetical protein